MAAQINSTVSKYVMAHLKRQSPTRALLPGAGTSSRELNNGSSMATIQRDQATRFAYQHGLRMSLAMLCEKKRNLEIQARDTFTTLAHITHFADDWWCMYCPECNKEFKETSNTRQCPECLKYTHSIPILRLTMMVSDGPESAIFQARGEVAEDLLGHKTNYLMGVKEEKGVEHVFNVLYEVLHRQIVFQVKMGTYRDNRNIDFEVTKAFVKRNCWAQLYVEDLMAEDNKGTLENLNLPLNTKKYFMETIRSYSPTVWRIGNKTISNGYDTINDLTNGMGKVAMEEEYRETSMEDLD